MVHHTAVVSNDLKWNSLYLDVQIRCPELSHMRCLMHKFQTMDSNGHGNCLRSSVTGLPRPAVAQYT